MTLFTQPDDPATLASGGPYQRVPPVLSALAGQFAGLTRVRAAILAEIRAGAMSGPPGDLGRSRRPARFVARRTAWHAVDHAWEIQDKQEP